MTRGIDSSFHFRSPRGVICKEWINYKVVGPFGVHGKVLIGNFQKGSYSFRLKAMFNFTREYSENASLSIIYVLLSNEHKSFVILGRCIGATGARHLRLNKLTWTVLPGKLSLVLD